MKQLFFFLLLCLASCSEYKALTNEVTIVSRDSIVYFADKEMDIVNVNISGVNHQLLFDTGAGPTVLYNPKFDLSKIEFVKERTVYGFDKKQKIKLKGYVVDSFACGSYKMLNKYLFVAPVSKLSCGGTFKYDGVAARFVPHWDALTELNYQEGFIRFSKKPDLSGYYSLEAKFVPYNGMFYIKLEVEGISDYFLFDTGNTTLTMLNKKIFTKPYNKLLTLQTLNVSVSDALFPMYIEVFPKQIKIGQFEFNYTVGIDQQSERSIVSATFIKNFNWIIDQKNNKVYCKPINPAKLLNKKEIKIPENLVRATVWKDELLVGYLNFESEIYHLGDRIIEVDHQKVNAENACEMATRLNSTSWREIKIVTVPASKHY
ncbi:MAG TPA: hypothetical protein VGB50_13020 [Flavobacterium sp.]|jgi:hypothetical protein